MEGGGGVKVMQRKGGRTGRGKRERRNKIKRAGEKEKGGIRRGKVGAVAIKK